MVYGTQADKPYTIQRLVRSEVAEAQLEAKKLPLNETGVVHVDSSHAAVALPKLQ